MYSFNCETEGAIYGLNMHVFKDKPNKKGRMKTRWRGLYSEQIKMLIAAVSKLSFLATAFWRGNLANTSPPPAK